MELILRQTLQSASQRGIKWKDHQQGSSGFNVSNKNDTIPLWKNDLKVIHESLSDILQNAA